MGPRSSLNCYKNTKIFCPYVEIFSSFLSFFLSFLSIVQLYILYPHVSYFSTTRSITIHVPGGIRIRNRSKLLATELLPIPLDRSATGIDGIRITVRPARILFTIWTRLFRPKCRSLENNRVGRMWICVFVP